MYDRGSNCRDRVRVECRLAVCGCLAVSCPYIAAYVALFACSGSFPRVRTASSAWTCTRRSRGCWPACTTATSTSGTTKRKLVCVNGHWRLGRRWGSGGGGGVEEVTCMVIRLSQTLVKSFEVTDVPVRTARFVVRKSWVVAGSVSILDVSAILWACPDRQPPHRMTCMCVCLTTTPWRR